jgi:hypothetical protein
MPIIPALGKLRQENLEFKPSLGYIARPCLAKNISLSLSLSLSLSSIIYSLSIHLSLITKMSVLPKVMFIINPFSFLNLTKSIYSLFF